MVDMTSVIALTFSSGAVMEHSLIVSHYSWDTWNTFNSNKKHLISFN